MTDDFYWSLAKLLAKNEIGNTSFKYQLEMFNQCVRVGNVSLNNVTQYLGYKGTFKVCFLLSLSKLFTTSFIIFFV